MDKTPYILVKVNSRQYAIYDPVSGVYYYGKKRDLIKRLKELNSQDNEDSEYGAYYQYRRNWFTS